MTTTPTPAHSLDYQQPGVIVDPTQRPLRLWPISVVVLIYWAFRVYERQVELVTSVRFISLFGSAILVGLIFVFWWTMSRRVPRNLRWPGVISLVAGWGITSLVADKSVNPVLIIYWGLPLVVSAWLGWLFIMRHVETGLRRPGVMVVIALSWSFMALIRFEGTSGEQRFNWRWRWTLTDEERYMASLAQAAGKKTATPSSSQSIMIAASPTDWPAFRGPGRDGVARGVNIRTDFSAAPPKLLWRGPSGPGWSSPAVAGGRVYIHEQRLENEAVVCRDLLTGDPLWAHVDRARFFEGVGGAGPRATPTVAGGRVFSFGATGLLNCLDAIDGRAIWSRNVVADNGAVLPMWALSSSPLVTGGVVIVWAGGPGNGLSAYRIADGSPAWSVPAGKNTYTSPQLVTLGGKEQVVMLTEQGLLAVDPATGARLWDYPAASANSTRAVQPQPLDGGLLISSELDIGVGIVDVKQDGGNWSAHSRWTSRAMKPSFNDLVIHDGHLYGFDGAVFCCVDVATGKRKWRDGRYGHGQVVLLADQAVLLVATEEGEVVALEASPAGHKELGQFKAVEGKVWAHPAVAGNRIVVRSEKETAVYEMSVR